MSSQTALEICLAWTLGGQGLLVAPSWLQTEERGKRMWVCIQGPTSLTTQLLASCSEFASSSDAWNPRAFAVSRQLFLQPPPQGGECFFFCSFSPTLEEQLVRSGGGGRETGWRGAILSQGLMVLKGMTISFLVASCSM